MSRRVDRPTETSSSTMETNRSSALGALPRTVLPPAALHDASVAVGGAPRLAVPRDRSDSARVREPELRRHPDQRGHRVGLHLLHDVRAMELDRSLGGRELAGDLLVEQPCDDARKDLALSRRELLVALAQRLGLEAFLV